MQIRVLPKAESLQGAHKFARLLRSRLAAMGHQIVPWDSEDKCDVCMVRGSLSGRHLERTLGLDGRLVVLYGGHDVSPESSRLMKMTLGKADGIIYNSRHGEDFVHKICRPGCREIVIPNGAEEGPLASLDGKACLVACDSYDMPEKHRALMAAIEAMPLIRKDFPEIKLRVLGRAPKIDGVELLGHVEDEMELASIRQGASLLLHLVENDNCPNTVLESLGQGLPVVCHGASGTPEICGFFGASVWSLDPPEIARAAVAFLTIGKKWQDRWMHTFRSALCIDAVARRYDMFLKTTLEEKKCARS